MTRSVGECRSGTHAYGEQTRIPVPWTFDTFFTVGPEGKVPSPERIRYVGIRECAVCNWREVDMSNA